MMMEKIKIYALSAGRMRPVEDGYWSIPEWCKADDVEKLEQELSEIKNRIDNLKSSYKSYIDNLEPKE